MEQQDSDLISGACEAGVPEDGRNVRTRGHPSRRPAVRGSTGWGRRNARSPCKRSLATRLRQNNPTGRFPLSLSGKSLLELPTSCPQGRALAIVTNVGTGCGGRSGVVRAMGWQGGLRARERSQDVLTSGAEAYGEVVWSWRLNGWRQVFGGCRPDRARMRQPFAGDGDNKARFSGESTK